jgi:hypothetical protein
VTGTAPIYPISKTHITALVLLSLHPSIPITELVCFVYPLVSESAPLTHPMQRLRHVMISSLSPTCSSTFYAAPFPGAS